MGAIESGGRPAAIVTGASRGVGLGIARVLANAGHDLTLVSRRVETMEAAKLELSGAGIELQTIAADLRDPDAPGMIVERHAEAYARLDVLVNNAGVAVAAPVDEMRTNHIDLLLQVNVRAIILSYRSATPLLLETARSAGSALVVNVASITGRTPAPLQSVYGATKAAVINFTRAMNDELAERGVRSTALCPGMIDTDMVASFHDTVPPEEMLSVDDVAGAVGWLLTTSPRCIVPDIPFLRPGAAV